MEQKWFDQWMTILTDFRKDLHAHPEVSEFEFETSERIKTFLTKYTNAQIENTANTGVLAIFDSGVPGPSLMLRADTDALPIQEINDFEHKSLNEGVSHKCGHDGHTSIMTGVAIKLTAYPPKKGKVILLFQPAEENGMGAKGVIDDGVIEKHKIEKCYALHNLPGFEKNEIICKPKAFTANVQSIIIKLSGKTAHAAEPEKGQNPALAIANILQYADQNTLNDPNKDDFFLFTPIHINMGELAYGISAGYGELHLTIRSWSPELIKQKCKALTDYIQKTALDHQLIADIQWTQVFHSNQNDPSIVDDIKQAASIHQLKYSLAKHPFKWGEDFGLFTQKIPGAMFGLGAGEDTPALHNPDYDYPDDITVTGIKMFTEIINLNLH